MPKAAIEAGVVAARRSRSTGWPARSWPRCRIHAEGTRGPARQSRGPAAPRHHPDRLLQQEDRLPVDRDARRRGGHRVPGGPRGRRLHGRLPPADPRFASLPEEGRDKVIRGRLGFALEQLARLREGGFAFELAEEVPGVVGGRDIRLETLAKGINPQEMLLELAQGIDEDRASRRRPSRPPSRRRSCRRTRWRRTSRRRPRPAAPPKRRRPRLARDGGRRVRRRPVPPASPPRRPRRPTPRAPCSSWTTRRRSGGSSAVSSWPPASRCSRRGSRRRRRRSPPRPRPAAPRSSSSPTSGCRPRAARLSTAASRSSSASGR